MPSITIENLVATYGRNPVLHDVSLELPDNKISVLLGPSGSGKSTLLMAVAGLVNPTAGRIAIGTDVLFDRAARRNVLTERRDIGIVFQSHALWGHMTVAQNIAFPLKQRRPRVPRAEIARRVEEMVSLVGLDGLAGRYPGQLSGGQAQRVSLARGLVAHPRVLLLDEPLSAVDAKVRIDLRHLIQRLQQETGTTMLLVTHDRADAEMVADAIVVMKDGRVVENGSAGDLLHQPARTFTAQFLLDAIVLRGRRDAAGLSLESGDRIAFVSPAAASDGTQFGVTATSFLTTPDPAGTARVEAVDRVAGQFSLRVRLPGGTVVGSLSLEPIEPGAAVTVALRPDRVFPLTD